MHYFDHEKIARDANIPPQDLEKLREAIRQEFPHDELMFELHLLRACMAIKAGVLTVDQATGSQPAGKP